MRSATALLILVAAAGGGGCICGAIADPDPALLEGAPDAGTDAPPPEADAGDAGGCRENGDCADGIDCTHDFCDAQDGTCFNVTDHTDCAEDELCLDALGCVPRHPCAVDADCTDASACNGVERCLDDACMPGEPLECDDGLFCNGAETCDEELGCVAAPPACSDGIDCTTDACDAELDECVHSPLDATCDNGKWCDGPERCDASLGCRPGLSPCDDGADCSADDCIAVEQTCVHHADHARCDDGEICRIGALGAYECAAAPCGIDEDCDDGDACNGLETCGGDLSCEWGTGVICDDGLYCTGQEACRQGVCLPQDAPSCSDGVACTTDACDSLLDACTSSPSDVACADDRVCNGAETCGVLGCEPSLPPSCDDGNACTVDACREQEGGCVAAPQDRDADGAGDAACGGADCDDLDPFVGPDAAEICNDVDDDCDVEVDEDFDCSRGATSPCTSACDSTGRRTCTDACSWGACEPPAEDCNGTDDDCDGSIDEGCTCDAGDPTSCTTSCGTTGTRQCQGGQWSACAPPAESCNGRDDDCDADVDEDFDCTAGDERACQTDCGGQGAQSCSNACKWLACVAPEVCNGEDDDCDDACDETFACCASETTECVTTCGSVSHVDCTPNCTRPGNCPPPTETCNGADDNCDGQCDNGDGAVCCRGTREHCTVRGTMQGTRDCSDACEWSDCCAASERCANNRDDDCDGDEDEQDCCDYVAGQPDACNGLDDDCDGLCDDDGQCCQGSVSPCTTECGTVGSATCSADCALGPCIPPAEVCDDGVDDDCDGSPDAHDPDCA